MEPKAVKFKLVQQSFEDKDYADKPKPVLVEVKDKSSKRKAKKSAETEETLLEEVFGEGNEPTEDYSKKRNMLMVDDTKEGDDDLFRDTTEGLDDDFIHAILEGQTAHEEVDDVAEVLQDENYPTHDHRSGTAQVQFSRMLKEFSTDLELNNPEVEDSRVQGPLQAESYAGALQEFIEDHAGVDRETLAPLKNRSRVEQIKRLALQNRVFDNDDGGYFLTTVPSEQKKRVFEQHLQIVEEEREKALERIRLRDERKNQEGAANAASSEEEDPKDDFVAVEVKRKEDRYDCETIISTASTAFNHPNVIRAKSLVTKPSRRKEKSQEQVEPDINEEGESDADSSHDKELFTRKPDETPEERKNRRKLVKERQREKRAQKKVLKETYKSVTSECSKSDKNSKESKRTIALP